MDRAIILELRRKLPSEKVERLRHAETGLFERLASMLARWAQDNGQMIGRFRPALPEVLNDRAQDNWEPLLAIADSVGGEWPKLARDAARNISGSDDAVSLSAELLTDIREIFNKRDVSRITTADLLHALNDEDLAPWATYNRGKPMSPRQLAKRLSEYGIKPDLFRVSGTPCRGYSLHDFEDVFSRYLYPSDQPPDLSVTTLQNTGNAITALNSSVTDKRERNCYTNPSVTDNILINKACNTVTDKNSSLWEETTI
jgi:putative DNA primase/helicase